jgi:3-deoxy-D-manno-octulosonic-acid transferase
VGEGLAALPVCRRLRAAHPTTPIILTYTSAASRQWPGGWPLDHADFLPADEPGPVAAMLEALRPRLLVFSRADVWPELAWAALARGRPVALVGGAVRPHSGRLRWPVRRLLRSVYRGLAYAGAVSGPDGERLLRLGVHPAVLEVTGDPRQDEVIERVPDWGAVRPLASWAAAGAVLVAGSTDPKDDQLLLDALSQLRPHRPTARLLLCPHHPGAARTAWILARARRRGITAVPWRGEPLHDDASCVIVERLGVLADLYLLGTLAYVGGGLGAGGVHAVIEPAACALPVVVGPRGHSEDVARLLQAGGAAALPRGNPLPTLRELWHTWLENAPARQVAGLAARRTLELGAADRTAARLLELIGDY